MVDDLNGIGRTHFESYILGRIDNNKNFISAITGGTGSGKTYSALYFAEHLDQNFDIDNVVFSAKAFMDLINGKVKQLKKGSVILFDEFQITMNHRKWQGMINTLINYVLTTFRHKGFILIITVPFFKYIDSDSRLLFHCRMETRHINYKGKYVVLKPFIRQVNQNTMLVYEKYLRVKNKKGRRAVLKRVRAYLPSAKLVDEYEKKRNAFTKQLNEDVYNKINKLEFDESNKAILKKELTVLQQQVVDCWKENMTKQKDIAQKIGRSPPEICQTVRLILKKGYKMGDFAKENAVLGENKVN